RRRVLDGRAAGCRAARRTRCRTCMPRLGTAGQQRTRKATTSAARRCYLRTGACATADGGAEGAYRPGVLCTGWCRLGWRRHSRHGADLSLCPRQSFPPLATAPTHHPFLSGQFLI
ncbi:hypothetical protein MAPG_11990, partial [Magnaporthiopsis poae ATCC 64411]